MPPGASWGEAIVEALVASDALVVVYSSHANVSQQVERELALAFEERIPIVPFRTDDSEVSDGIRYYTGGIPWLMPKVDDPGQQLAALKDHLTRQREPADLSRRRTASASIATERVSTWFQAASTAVIVVAIVRLALEVLFVINPNEDFGDEDVLPSLAFFLPIHAAVAGSAIGFFLAWFTAAQERLVTFGVGDLRSPSGAAAFLVPVRNIITGSHALLEIWQASSRQPVRTPDRPGVGRRLSMYIGWVLANAGVVLNVHVMFVVMDDGELLPLASELLIASLCICIATVGARRFVRAVDRGLQILESGAPSAGRERHHAR